MRYGIAVSRFALVVAASLGAPAVFAHHSFAPHFDASKPVSISGTVTEYEARNPLGTSLAPVGLKLLSGYSSNSTLSKKHMYGLWRDCDPCTRSCVPALSMSGVIPMRVS